MNNITTISDVIDAFNLKGFKFVKKTSDGWFSLHGLLGRSLLEKDYPCEIQLDPGFLELPRIRLLETPCEMPDTVPHFSADGVLCYIDQGTVVLDMFDPIGQSLACLERAEKVFSQILKGEMVEDLTEEFFAYWNGIPCMVDIQGQNLGRQNCILAEASENLLWFVTDNEERTVRKINSLGYQATNKTVLTYRVKTTAQPRPLTDNWPPRTVRDILDWQNILDPRCRRKIHQRIKEGEKKNANGVLILIESPLITYGFAVLYGRDDTTIPRKLSNRRDTTFELKVMMVSVARIDDRYLAERNIPKLKTFAGKNITVVGCGTIGGYLSEMVVKAGAGTSGGKLTLVDFDQLLPQNIGRHRLGFPYLLENKATAMAHEIRYLAPGANICVLPVDVKKAELGKTDLLIDATGEESLGHWLCKKYLPHTPMLSVWIEGPGTAIRGLLKKNNPGACFRCLWHSNKKRELQSTTEQIPVILAGQGCEGLYVPFPASTSVQAASLGAELALDWVNGVYSPSLRTRLLDQAYTLATPDCDPLHDRDCPICNS